MPQSKGWSKPVWNLLATSRTWYSSPLNASRMSRPLRLGFSATLCSLKPVGSGLLVVHLAGERDERADLVAVLLDVLRDGQLPAHGLHPARDHDHRLAMAAEQRRHVLAEVLDDDLD